MTEPVVKVATWIPVTDEFLIDTGREPSPGYWRRQEEYAIWRRRVRTRLLVAWRRFWWTILSIPIRIRAAGQAFRDPNSVDWDR